MGQGNSYFHAKPVKHKRTPPDKAQRNLDFDKGLCILQFRSQIISNSDSTIVHLLFNMTCCFVFFIQASYSKKSNDWHQYLNIAYDTYYISNLDDNTKAYICIRNIIYHHSFTLDSYFLFFWDNISLILTHLSNTYAL